MLCCAGESKADDGHADWCIVFIQKNAKMDLCQAIYADTRIKHKWPTAIVITAILVLYAGIFYGVGGLLSRGYHYRCWFELSSVLITYAGCMVLSLYWIIRWILFSDSVSKKVRRRKAIQKSNTHSHVAVFDGCHGY